MPMKQVLSTGAIVSQHWVGDGFPVRSLFTYERQTAEHSPFLLLDYAGPHDFSPTTARRGVGEHPHRGFETVTIVYHGEVDHRDSSGGGGRISPGDVQWMTAAGGLVHDEFHSEAFSRRGGRFEMVQLWVNLPGRSKLSPPRYQGIRSAQIPRCELPAGSGAVRVIAGRYRETMGPAHTVTPITLWDIQLRAGHDAVFSVPAGHTAMIALLRGLIRVGAAAEVLEGPRLVTLERAGEQWSVSAQSDATMLFLGGEPINEPVVAHGPFVMNDQAGIRQAILDFQEGRMGSLQPIAGSDEDP